MLFVSMQVYLRRSVQAKIKDTTDALLPPGTVANDVQQLSRVNPLIPLLDPDTYEYSASTFNISDSKTAQAEDDGSALVSDTHRSGSSHIHYAQPDPSKEPNAGSPPSPQP
jgi:hypothetical protein